MAADDVNFAGKQKPSGSKLQNFCNTIWNGEKKEFIGRTAGSWAKIGLFYLIFYGCLAGFFAIMLVGFFSTIDNTAPTQQNMYSLIKQNPGMGFRPMENIESTLIRFNRNKSETYKKHLENINDFLRKNKYVNDNAKPNPSTEGDDFDIGIAGEACTLANKDFGYAEGHPCVLLKINRVFNWEPKPFTNETLVSTEMGREAKQKLGDRWDPDYIGVTCEGENDADVDNLGKVEYYPKEGFATKYFPYKNQEGYKSPIVFAKFPKLNPGTIIQVWCKLWVENIKHHKNDKGGSVHFELLVD